MIQTTSKGSGEEVHFLACGRGSVGVSGATSPFVMMRLASGTASPAIMLNLTQTLAFF